MACRVCLAMWLKGVKIPLPPDAVEGALGLVRAGAAAGKAALAELERDPARRIQDYFDRAYQTAYLDGFFRALQFLHVVREGRMVRIRELWKQLTTVPNQSTVMQELDKLIRMTPEKHAQGDPNRRPAR